MRDPTFAPQGHLFINLGNIDIPIYGVATEHIGWPEQAPGDTA